MYEPALVPLSFAQQRLWLVHALQPDSPAYNLRTAYRLRGKLDPDALRAALRAIAQRHEVLRTTFMAHDGEPIGVVSAEFDLALPIHDLVAYPAGERAIEAERLLRAEADRPFDFARGPLLRSLMLRLEPDDHVFLIVVHHSVFDGGSVTPFNRELSALYAAFHLGTPAAVDELPIQYADYAAWQRAASDGLAASRALAYWRETLAGAPARIELPIDRPRRAGSARTGAIRSTVIAPALAARIAALGRSAGATLFVTLFAAFNVLLYRYTGQADLVVGTPIANRRRTELEPLIGFFVNTLAIRTQLQPSQSFATVLHRARDAMLAAFDQQDVPFERLVAALGPDRNAEETPLVNVTFFARTDPDEELQLHGLDIERRPLTSTRAKFDLSFRYAHESHGLTCSIQYDIELFDAATIDRFLQHFGRLLEAIADAPAAAIAALPLVEGEQCAALSGARIPAPPPTGRTLRERFEQHAAQTPDAPAVIDGSSVLSYAQLNARANELAVALRARDLAPQALVGIALPRSAATIVSMLAIVKAGGAYVPLDPDYPSERLRFMLLDTGVRSVVTNAATDAQFRALGVDDCLNLDALAPNAGPLADPPLAGNADDLAYVMYTSGSTGRPKGVLVTQSAIDALVTDTPAIAVGPADCVAQIANLCFDAATYEIWGALLNGAQLAIIPRDILLAPADFARFIRDRGMSVAFVTSAFFHHVSRQEPAAFAPLRCLITGGDVLEPAAVRAILAAGAPRQLLHAYGPTETTTFATLYAIDGPPRGSIPIGRPIVGTQAYILDAANNLVPIGVRGQLHIGGRGLARGYLNDPQATAHAFIRHPFAADPQARLYATGDIARYEPDGNIGFHGRRDRQIKRRGFRIELDEIEVALKALPDVRDAAVIVRDDVPGEKRIVAYVVTHDGAVRDALAQALPNYMLPDAIVTVATIPLNANGKLDLAQLAAAARSDDAGPAADAPLSATEMAVAEIFCAMLGAAHVGRTANFFALGGHSLLAARVIARIGDRFAIDITLREFFAAATVAELALRIDRANDRTAPAPRAPLGAELPELSDAQIDALLAQARPD